MATTKWALDPMHSELGFKIKHLMISNVSGSFTSFEAMAETHGTDFSTAKINLQADMKSISTNNEQRDAHLQNADFFEVDKFPELKFTSTKLEQADSDTYTMFGELTMKGVTKPVQLQVAFNGITKDPWGGERAGFSVTGKVKRSDWGISLNTALETGGLMLADEVKINAEVQLVKQVVAEPVLQ